MIDELDRLLRERLAALADAVPTSPDQTRATRLHTPAIHTRVFGFSALATATSALLVVAIAIALAGRGGPPAAGSPVPVVTTSPVPTAARTLDDSPSPAVTAVSTPSAPATRPPADVALPYPDGCPAYGLSPRRCAYIVDWALAQAGVAAGATVQLLGDPACDGEPAGCAPVRTTSFIVRVRVIPAGGESSDHPVFCGVLGEGSLLCTDTPVIRVSSPMSGYHDVPCGPVPGGQPGSRCATPVPTVAPADADKGVPLRVPSTMIAIDHAGGYAIDLGDAVLPNGILNEATATVADDRRTDVLIPRGIRLEILDSDGNPLENAYDHGWRRGTERVRVRLVFTVESFDHGATLEITDVVVR